MKSFTGYITISVRELIRRRALDEMFIDIPEDTARKLIFDNLRRIPEENTKQFLKTDLYEMLLDELGEIAKHYAKDLSEYLAEEIRKKAEE